MRHFSIATTWNNAISGIYARLISSINSIDPIDQLLDNTSSNAVQNPRGTTADSVARIPSVFTFNSMQLQQLQLALLSCIINLQPEAY